LKRAGLAVTLALALLIGVLWFGDGEPPRPPPPKSAIASPSQPATLVPQADAPALPEADIPAQTDTTTVTEPADIPAPVAEKTGVPSTPSSLDTGAIPDTTTPSSPTKTATSPKKTVNAPESPKKAANAIPKPTSLTDGYFVQLGVFDDTENTYKVFDNVAELGLSAHIQSRVMVGPFRNKREAEAARNRLKGIAEGTVLPPQAKASGKSRAKSKSRQRVK
jgi:DedD protein